MPEQVIIRFFDILFSALGIIVLFPFMVPIMIVLKLTGEHDIFYRQARVGLYGKEFGVLKFATMLRNSPNMSGGYFTGENDPRILPLGKLLRKTKINELPQLVNILAGEMSIVGYRPLVPAGYAKYSDEMKAKLYNYRPGLSGLGSIMLRNEEEIMRRVDNKDNFYTKVIIPYKAELETWYIEHISVLNYFKVIVATIIIVLRPSSNVCGNIFNGMPVLPNELKSLLEN